MVAHVIVPSALNVLIIGASVIVFGFIMRAAAMFWAGTAGGNAVAVVY